MKRIIALICAAALCVSMCACARTSDILYETNLPYTSMFIGIEEAPCWGVVYHKDTKVMYVISTGTYNRGSFTMLVNPDGTPQIYKGE